MNLDDIKGKATELTDKAAEALGSDKVETVTDKVLDGAATVADKVTGGKFTDKIASARDTIDEKLGQ